MKGGPTRTIQALISLKEAVISISMHRTSRCKPAVLLGNAAKDSAVKASIHGQGPECVFCRLFPPRNAELISGFFLLIVQNHSLRAQTAFIGFSLNSQILCNCQLVTEGPWNTDSSAWSLIFQLVQEPVLRGSCQHSSCSPQAASCVPPSLCSRSSGRAGRELSGAAHSSPAHNRLPGRQCNACRERPLVLELRFPAPGRCHCLSWAVPNYGFICFNKVTSKCAESSTQNNNNNNSKVSL